MPGAGNIAQSGSIANVPEHGRHGIAVSQDRWRHLRNRFVDQQMGMFVSDSNPEDLATLRDLLQAGKVKPVVDRTYPLAQIVDAIRYLEDGHARGKVVIRLD